MQIQRSGRANDLFCDQLRKFVVAEKQADVEEKPKEQQLEEDRKDKGQEAEADKTMETQLKDDRKGEEEPALYEKLLEEHRKAEMDASNKEAEGVTEKRLNEASQENYPHRNPKAYERTGDKRPINALPEEMGNASDEAKRDRYEKANKAGKEKRALDKDVGSQMSNKKASFNLRAHKFSVQESASAYVAYRKTAMVDKFAEVRTLDETMSGIMDKANTEKRALSHDELAQIAAMKDRKSELLGIK